MPQTQSYSMTANPNRPLPVAVRAQGARIWDADGKEYLDACGGAMVMSLGHCHPRLVKALTEQASKLTFTYRFSFGNEPMTELAQLLHERAPMDGAWSFFNSSGSESVESAIHLAVLYWQTLGKTSKLELISRYPSYHGSTLGALGLSGSRWRKAFELLLEKNAVAETPNSDIRSGRTPEQELEFAVGEIEDAIINRGPEHVAAVFLEPISGASAAAVVPPDDYLRRVRELCDRYEVLLICDETVTGFGRTGSWFASEQWDFKPDVVTFAKGVTSGVTPFSGLMMSGRVAEVFLSRPDGFPWGHTFSGNPLGCAVACEAIRTIEDDNLLENSRRQGARLRAGLDALMAGSPIIGRVSGRGLLQGIELVRDRDSLEPLEGASARLTAAARARGMMIYSCPTPLGRRVIEAVMFAPPLIVNESDVDEMLEKFAGALADLEAQT